MSIRKKLNSIKFNFVALKQETVDAFESVFADLSNVNVNRMNILQAGGADCIVSPANSFGMMDGGVDGPINYTLDNIDTRLVRPTIQKYFYGEQPVGTCVLFSTGNPKYKYLAHTPTMRRPLDVQNTHIAYTILYRGG
jgi:O-acetyl-ADP-ribose deacetylase (regulator of RNase III)